MAQRRGTSRSRSSGATASKGSGDAAASADPDEGGSKRSGKVQVRAGGFVTDADPVAPTPDPIIPCSVCGSTLVDDRCPNGHGGENKSGGWRIADADDEGG